jgi:hypothetical protein
MMKGKDDNEDELIDEEGKGVVRVSEMKKGKDVDED